MFKSLVSSTPLAVRDHSAGRRLFGLLVLSVSLGLAGSVTAAGQNGKPPATSATYQPSGNRWINPEFSYSIPSFDPVWTVRPELSLPAGNPKTARHQVSFTANGGATRFELTLWDKQPGQTLQQWFDGVGKGLCGTTGVTIQSATTPSGAPAIWASLAGSIQAVPSELFFLTSDTHAFCVRYVNGEDGANRDSYRKLCHGLLTTTTGRVPGANKVGAPVPLMGSRVAQCGPVVDSCNCGGNNPYPCCWNGSNCTWGAWDRMCCNWGYAAGNWGNAETWGVYAQAAGNWVQSTPTVGSVGCRRVHSDTPYGHVAYVLSVSATSVYCIQMNCGVGGAGWSYQTFAIGYFTGGYITRTNPNPAPPTVIVVDNTSGGFAASTGWGTATSAADKYGTNYRYKSTAAVSDAASWTVNITAAGNYTIAAWWSAGTNRSATAPYILPNNATVHKNQQTSGGSWQNLGVVSLATGNRTTKLSCWTTTGYVVVADAIRYTKN